MLFQILVYKIWHSYWHYVVNYLYFNHTMLPSLVNFMLLLVLWFHSKLNINKPKQPNSCMTINNTWLLSFLVCTTMYNHYLINDRCLKKVNLKKTSAVKLTCLLLVKWPHNTIYTGAWTGYPAMSWHMTHYTTCIVNNIKFRYSF